MKKYILAFMILFCGIVSQAQWERTNGPVGCTVHCFLINGPDLLAGTSGGIFKYTGFNWDALGTGLPNTDITCLGKNGLALFAATSGYGIYKSTDTGQTWTVANNGLTNWWILSMAAEGNYIYAGTNEGLFRTSDNGDTWIRMSSGLPSGAQIITLGVEDSIVFAGTFFNGIFRSTDHGNFWMDANSSGTANTGVTAIRVNGQEIFIGTSNGVFKSADAGITWTPANTNLPPGAGMIRSFAFNGNLIFTGTNGYGVYMSADDGANWSPTGLMNEQAISLEYWGNTVFAGVVNNGVYASADNGQNWLTASTGLTGVYIHAVAVMDTLVFVSGSNGAIYMTSDNGLTWIKKPLGISPISAVNALVIKGSKIYAGTDNGIYFSTDHGDLWTPLGLGTLSVYALAVDEPYIYAGTTPGVYMSDDNGATWTLTTENNTVFSMSVCNSIVYAGCNPGLYISSDHGASWLLANNGLNDFYIFSLSTTGPYIYAGTPTGIYRSGDNGASWNEYNNGLSDLTIFAIMARDSNILVGTFHGGVCFSTNYGSNWFPENEGLGDSTILCLDMTRSYVFAGTAHGVWRRPVPQMYILNIHPDTLSLGNTSMSYDTLFMQSNSSWTLEGTMPDWLAASLVNGIGSDTIIFHSVLPNPDAAIRTAGFTLVSATAPSSSLTVTQSGSTGLDDKMQNLIKIFPNPTHGITSIRSDKPMERIVVTSLTGTVISDIPCNGNNLELDLYSQPKGVYFISITGKNWVEVRRIVIL